MESGKKRTYQRIREKIKKIRGGKNMRNLTKPSLVAGWSLTKACNLNCRHCYNASGKPAQDELDLGQCVNVVDKLARANVMAVNFGGGECALRTDFLAISRYLKENRIRVSYTTNGTTFDTIADDLYLFHDVGVSIDFASPEKHDWFRGKKGVFNQATQSLEHLVREGTENEMVTCLTKLNCSEYELTELYNLACKLGVDTWRLNRFRANGRGIKNESELALTKEALNQAYTFLSKLIVPSDNILTPEPVFRSAFGGNYYYPGDPSGFTSFRIQPDGEVSPSVFLSESGGNIKEKTIEEILDSKIFRKIRNRKPKGKCKNCIEYEHCRGGDAGASFLAYEHFNGPDPLCWLNPSNLEEKKQNTKQKQDGDFNVHELYLCTLYVPVSKK
jgi:radical SAM protein with 4Fe4S-binding SPASM domain